MRVAAISSCLFLTVIFAAPPPVVEEFSAEVIGVTDGDTITVLRDRKPIRIRLEGIDAPEKSQAFGSKAKSSLSSIVFRKSVTVRKTGTDRYGRTLARIFVGKDDVSALMIKHGMAWHYKEYSKDEGLAVLEEWAREAKIGIWSEDNALPPWEFRHRKSTYKRPVPVAEVEPMARTPQAAISSTAQPQGEQSDTARPSAKPSLTHWLNTSSNARHNPSCQYYKNTKRGRLCTADEGKPCGKCGG